MKTVEFFCLQSAIKRLENDSEIRKRGFGWEKRDRASRRKKDIDKNER